MQGTTVQIEAVGLVDSQYYDRTIRAEQYDELVREIAGSGQTFDAEPRLFRLAVEALRTHLAHTFDPQYAVSVSQVDPLPHQLDAVYRHILPLPRIRFLLADDPGAGKTIMAGLLMRELMRRGDVRRVLVLCPKALTDQWRREMWERFRELFVLVTGDLISSRFGQNVWVENDHVVASVDLAIQDHILPGIDQSNWDLVIFDEAHKLSAYRYGASGKIDKTKRYMLAERLAVRTKHLLLMTATPHKGDSENFRLLMALLDENVFASQAGTQNALNQESSPFFLRRMKEAMRNFDGSPIFLPRHVKTLAYELAPHEQALYDAVTNYVSNGLAQAEEARNRNVTLALIVLQRRLASSLHAVTRSLERRRDRLSEELKQACQGNRPPARAVTVTYDMDENEIEDLSDDDEEALSGASMARTAAELQAEIAQLSALITLAEATRHRGPERKLEEFRRVVRNQTVMDRNEKILVFTEHRDTLIYLTHQLSSWGHSVCNIHGGMKLADRIAAEKEFRGPAQFMVATEAAGEGINLQFCKVMINWDLPWNPNRLEQRMGRIHRYGQEYEVQVINVVANTTREGSVLVHLMNKLDRMRAQLGHDQVYDVVSSVLDAGQVRLDTLLRQAILNRRSMDDILADLDFVDTSASVAAARDALGEALATSHIDLGSIMGDDRDSKERRLTPEFVERFFVDGFRYLKGRVRQDSDSDWVLDFAPAEIRREVASRNSGEFGSENRRITFRKERLRRDPPAEFVAPDHPLFDAVLHRILDQGRPVLAKGAVFVDKETLDSYLVWLLEAAVVNGRGDIVHRRLLALRQRGNEFETVAPGVLLDLPPSSVSPPAPAKLLDAADSDAAVSAATRSYTREYLDEVTTEQVRQACIVEIAIQKSANENLAHLQQRLERQHEDEANGKDMRIAIRSTNDQIERLTTELRDRRTDLQRSKVTSLQTPRVIGVAAIIPAPAHRVAEHASGGDYTAVEMAAMKAVLDHEKSHGRTAVDVSKSGAGYDIRSAGHDGDVRYIEVKGHKTTGDVVLYYTEWQMAHRMRKEFFIYEVNYALTNPSIQIVQDPVGRGLEPTEKVVEYHIKSGELALIATNACDFETEKHSLISTLDIAPREF
ncbi:MAG: helicase-related protein [Chloroflexi bacterium]|nr:helicase-related protein [Chloroflexota bacterium]